MNTSAHSWLEIFPVSVDSHIELPFVKEGINAGFPSPANDFIEDFIDLNKELIKHPDATFLAKVRGSSMTGMGLDDGDVIIIDKSLELQHHKVAICVVDGEFTIKKVKKDNGCYWLIPYNSEYKSILVTPENEFMVWGIVTYIIKAL